MWSPLSTPWRLPPPFPRPRKQSTSARGLGGLRPTPGSAQPFPGSLTPTACFHPEVQSASGEEKVRSPPLERLETSGLLERSSLDPMNTPLPSTSVFASPAHHTKRGDDTLRGRRSRPFSTQSWFVDPEEAAATWPYQPTSVPRVSGLRPGRGPSPDPVLSRGRLYRSISCHHGTPC